MFSITPNSRKYSFCCMCIYSVSLNFPGWDISGHNLAEAMKRAEVLDYNLQVQLVPFMETMKPRPSLYYPDFIAANQADRADNLIPGSDKWEHMEQIRRDIRDFKQSKSLDKVRTLKITCSNIIINQSFWQHARTDGRGASQ